MPSAFYRGADVEPLVVDDAGKGVIHYRSPKREFPVEYIDADTNIGIYCDVRVERYKSTKRFEIVYAKRGVHAYPVKEIE